MKESFEWIDFYKELADKLYEYKDKKDELYEKIKVLMQELVKEMTDDRYFTSSKNAINKKFGGKMNPFTVYGIFNHIHTVSSSEDYRKEIAEKINKKDHFNLKANSPKDFSSIPPLPYWNAWYFVNKQPNMWWNLFEAARAFSVDQSKTEDFVTTFDEIIKEESSEELHDNTQYNNLEKITLGLYYINPEVFIPLNDRMRKYLYDKFGLIALNDDNVTGEKYLKLLGDIPKIKGAASIRRLIPKIVANVENNLEDEIMLEINNSKMFGEESLEHFGKNIILQGAPGTGKTYTTVTYAVAIIEGRAWESVERGARSEVFKRFNKYKESGLIEFVTFHQSYGYEDFIEGIRPVIVDGGKKGNQIEYEIHEGSFKAFCNKSIEATSEFKNKVFIIDEINRGNISKIFGELITLIEPTKRLGASDEQTAKLPYSQETFGVPSNVYIIGTMNTADRSIAMLDTALRRRFKFVDLQPDTNLLKDINIPPREKESKEVTVNVAKILTYINNRIEVLLDRDHVIGHSFFLPLKDDPTFERLGSIFKYDIIPLLREYFYDDDEKIRFVLGDELEDKNAFFQKDETKTALSAKSGEERIVYFLKEDVLDKPETYQRFK